MGDLPDWYSQVVSEAVEASSFTGGADAAKPASPVSRDVYLATNTGILYVCYTDGVWTNIGNLYLLLAGGTMSGAIAMGGYKITGVGAPVAATDAARKSEVDTVDAKLDDVTESEPAYALDTVYQNTGGKIKVVSVCALCRVSESAGLLTGQSQIHADIGSANPPANIISYAEARCTYIHADTGGILRHLVTLTFVVPPSWYYRVVTVASGGGVTPTLSEWHEWDLL